MIELVPFEPWHAEAMCVQKDQEREAWQECLRTESVTILKDRNVPLLIGGVVQIWQGRGVAWSIISKHAAGNMLHVTRITREFLESSGLRRIEMMVRSSFDAGHRWAKLLGFESEGMQKDFRPYEEEGFRDEHIYVRLL